MSRKNFTAKTKLAAWRRSGGGCEVHLMDEDIKHLFAPSCDNTAAELDHRVADILDGEPTLDNAAYLCKACHKIKTKSDAGYRKTRNKHAVNRDRPHKDQPKQKMQSRPKGSWPKRAFPKRIKGERA